MTAISRTQAYAKLVILMVDHGLPAPKEIIVSTTYKSVSVNLSHKPDFDRWIDHFSAPLDPPFTAPSGHVLHEGTVDAWHGYHLRIIVHVPGSPPEPEPVTEDMTRVRAVAERGEDEQPPRCAGCGKTGRISPHRPGCSVAAAFDVERAGAVSE